MVGKKTRAKQRTATSKKSRKVSPKALRTVEVSENRPANLADEEIERALAQGEMEGPLADYFGEAELKELQVLSRQASREQRARGPRVIILPGIMGSRLGFDRFGPLDDVIWIDPIDIVAGRLEKLKLTAESLIKPLGVLLVTYLRMKLNLKIRGFDASFHDYDWRRSPIELGKQLAERIRGENKKPVHLVAHSMGGLVARAAASQLTNEQLKSVIMLGTPNHGSFSPVTAMRATDPMVRKLAAADLHHDAEELAVKVFSTLTGLHEMLPSPEHYPDIDFFDAQSWPAGALRPDQRRLTAARKGQASVPLPDERFTLVAGTNQNTIIGARQQDGEFVYTTSLRGDGTVPLDLCLVEGVKQTYYADAKHGSMPNKKFIIRAVADILKTGSTNSLPTTDQTVRTRETDAISDRNLRHDPFGGLEGMEIGSSNMRDLLSGYAEPLKLSVDDVSHLSVGQDALDASSGVDDEAMDVTQRQTIPRRLEITLAEGSITEVDCRAIVLGIFSRVAPGGAARAVDEALGGTISQFVARRMLNGNMAEVSVLPVNRSSMKTELLAFAGLGPFDSFTETSLEGVAENLIRVLVATNVEEFATVPFGSGTGLPVESVLFHLFKGFLVGCRDVDADNRLQRITICENDPIKAEALWSELKRLSNTTLFEDVELRRRRISLPVTVRQTRAGYRATGPDPVYLTVRSRFAPPDPEKDIYSEESLIFESSVLTSGSKATVFSDSVAFEYEDLMGLLDEVGKDSFGPDDLKEVGGDLAELVLSQDTRTILNTVKDSPVVIVHDDMASKVPWETLRLNGHRPSLSGGMSRLYYAEDLSVSKWLEQRIRTPELQILMVINPTLDLDGAEEEGERIRQIVSNLPGITLHEVQGVNATRTHLLDLFSSGKFDVIHYAGHAFFDPLDPARSGIYCAHEEVLSGRDLVALANLPSLAFFNACEAARVRGKPRKAVSIQRRLEENVGLAEAFLRGGVANYVGTYWPVGDSPAKAFADTFYASLLKGKPIGEALSKGREAVHALGSIDWADYIHYGDREFRLKVR